MINEHIPINRQKPLPSSPLLALLIIIASVLVSGQQIAALFDTPVAVNGRWVSVGLLIVVCTLSIFIRRTTLVLPIIPLLFMMYWLGWRVGLGLMHGVSLETILEERVAHYAILLAGIGLVARLGSQRNAITLLNKSFLTTNVLLVVLSVVFFAPELFLFSARFVGIFRNPNYLSFAAANMFILFFLGWQTQRWRKTGGWQKILLIICTSTALVVLLATRTRGAWLGVLMAIAVYYFARNSRRLVIVFGGLAIGLILLSNAYSEQLSEPFYEFVRLERSYEGAVDLNQFTSGRYNIFRRSLSELQQHPERLLMGTGQRTWVDLGSKVREADWHDPIALLHSEGVIGYLAKYVFALYLLFVVYRGVQEELEENEQPPIWGYQMALLLAVRMIFSSLADSNLNIGHLDYLYYWLFAGIAFVRVASPQRGRRFVGVQR